MSKGPERWMERLSVTTIVRDVLGGTEGEEISACKHVVNCWRIVSVAVWAAERKDTKTTGKNGSIRTWVRIIYRPRQDQLMYTTE